MSSSVVATRAAGGGGDRRLERGEHALAVGLAERDEPHAGRDPVGAASACRKAVERRRQRNAVAGARDADRHRKRDLGPDAVSASSAGARPGRARGVEEGAALRGRFQMALLRGREGRGKLRDGARARQRHRRAPRGARARRTPRRRSRCPRSSITREPVAQRGGVADVAGLHRPFDAARIRERADRIGRRQPRHQAIERGGVERRFLSRLRRTQRLAAFVPAQAGTQSLSVSTRRHDALGPRLRGDERRRGRAPVLARARRSSWRRR